MVYRPGTRFGVSGIRGRGARFGVAAGPISEYAPNLIAFYDFREGAVPVESHDGDGGALPLTNGNGNAVSFASDGPFGTALVLAGNNFLSLANASMGPLNIGAFGNNVTVIAWAKRGTTNQSQFIAGQWWEGDASDVGQRSYGLFVDLPISDGEEQVCGHVSRTGDATPGYAWSIDYSANYRKVATNYFRFVGFTYNGAEARSYLDGCFEPKSGKNPYTFADGLNPTCTADFRIGATKDVTDTNFFTGRIGGVAIFDGVLTQAQMMAIHIANCPAGTPLFVFDYSNVNLPLAFNDTLSNYAWRGMLANGTETTSATTNWRVSNVSSLVYLNTPATASASFAWYEHIASINASQIGDITFRLNNSVAADTLRLAVKIGGSWYATDTTYSVTGDGRTGGDWSTAETKTFSMSLAANTWRSLAVNVGTAMTLGNLVETAIADGEVTGIGFYSAANTGIVRIDDLLVYGA